MPKKDLEKRLLVGTKIKLGKKYCKHTGDEADKIITLVSGEFETDNGLYTETLTSPSVWNHDIMEFDSIYHMFGNELDEFMDCEILT